MGLADFPAPLYEREFLSVVLGCVLAATNRNVKAGERINMKTTLPWIIVLVLLAGLGLLFSANQRQAADLAQAHQATQEAQKGGAGTNDAGQTNLSAGGQANKDREDLLRLRNENRQLRDEKQQLLKQLQAAKQTALTPDPQHQLDLQKAMAEVQQLRAQSALVQQTNQIALCIQNLRQIDAAKQQWAQENNRPNGSLVGPQDVAPYFPSKTFPSCPGGGAYTINPIGLSPLCNIPGHVLP
jgi:hypothetical protein